MVLERTTGKSSYWNKVAGQWRDINPQRLWRSHSDGVNLGLLTRWFSAGQVERLLKTDLFDEAYGDGLFSMLKSKAKGVVGVDVSTVIVNASVERHIGLRASTADVRCLPFKESVFDVIVSNSTLDHFKTQDEIVGSLRELHRVLKTGGQLVITIDNLANPVIALRNTLLFRLLYRLGIVPYYVGKSFGPRRLSLELYQVGFDPLETTSIMHCPRVFAVAACRFLERYTAPKTQTRFLRTLISFERLSRWPTLFFTGYFVAVRAIKR